MDCLFDLVYRELGRAWDTSGNHSGLTPSQIIERTGLTPEQVEKAIVQLAVDGKARVAASIHGRVIVPLLDSEKHNTRNTLKR